MWGSPLGWTISLVLLAIMVLGLWWIEQAGAISAPTDLARNSENLRTLSLPVSPRTVVSMDKPQDAGPIYRRALGAVEEDEALYRRLFDSPRLYRGERLKAIDLLIEATLCADMSLFADRPERIINYENDPRELQTLEALGRLCNQIGLRDKEPMNALRYYEAAFSLGAKLFDERLAAPEMMAGMTLMGESAQGIMQAAAGIADDRRITAAREFEAARRRYYSERIEPLLRVLRSIDPQIVGRHGGDVYHIAQHAEERLWRIEATLALGRMRYFAGQGGSAGDQRGVLRMLESLQKDPDPMVRTAAAAAIELTPQQYRMLR
jgi:hypothetical protein